MNRPAVLIVEPEPQLRRELAQGLSKLGYEAVPTSGAEEGLRFAQGLGASVIVADEEVPEFGDASVLDELREANDGEGVLVILGERAEPPEELPDDVLYLSTSGLEPVDRVRRIRLVLVGWELGLEPDAELRTLVGDLSLSPALEVIRGLGRALVSGRMLLDDGEVVFDRGQVIAAAAGQARGVKAFCRLGVRSQGTFRVVLGRPGVSREIDSALEDLIIRAIEDRVTDPPSPRARLRVDLGPSFFSKTFAPLEQAILSEAQGGITVGTLLDRLGEATDGEILRALDDLREEEVVSLGEPEPGVRVVTDSTADLPRPLAREHGIEVVPLTVRFGDRIFKDGIDIAPREFYEELERGIEHPATNPPTPGELLAVYRSVDRDRDAISVHISALLSDTVRHARRAAEERRPELQELREGTEPARLEVVDSRQVSLGLGLLALFAARMARRGLGVDDIAARVREISPRIEVLFVVDTLEYLARGGRIGKAQAWVGSLLGIKPILGVVGGEVVPVTRVRGGRAAHPKILELFRERLDRDRPVFGGIAHARAPVWADRLKGLLERELRIEELHVAEMGPVVGTHAGPGAVGAALFQPTDGELELIRPEE